MEILEGPPPPTSAASREVCRVCGDDLEISQPDIQNPLRLLAVCVTCRAWHFAAPGPTAAHQHTMYWWLIEPTLARHERDRA